MKPMSTEPGICGTRITALLLLLMAVLLPALPNLAQPAVTTAEDAAAQVEKTGYYTIRLPGVPYRLYHETRLRYGWEPTQEFINRYAQSPDELHPFRNYPSVVWHITAPTSYHRNMPPGLLVMLVPSGPGQAPEAWRETLDQLNLVYVEISTPGSPPNHYAHAMALLAVKLVSDRYPLHPQRIYLAGQEVAADTAVTTAVLSPEVFSAAWLINGGGYLEQLPFNNDTLNGLAPNANRDVIRTAARQSRLLYLSTQTDIERAILLTYAQGYHQAGFRGLTVWDEPGAGAGRPSAEYLTKAIDLFDQPLHRGAEKLLRDAERSSARGRLADALKGYFAVQASAPTTEHGATAREQIKTLRAAYTEQVTAIEAQIAAGQTREAARAIGELKKAWDDLAEKDIERLEEAVRDAGRAGRERE